MAPHPIIMQVLHDDRSRVVAAALTRRRLLEQDWDAPGEEAAPALLRWLGDRALAFLAFVFCARTSCPLVPRERQV